MDKYGVFESGQNFWSQTDRNHSKLTGRQENDISKRKVHKQNYWKQNLIEEGEHSHVVLNPKASASGPTRVHLRKMRRGRRPR